MKDKILKKLDKIGAVLLIILSVLIYFFIPLASIVLIFAWYAIIAKILIFIWSLFF